MGFEARYEGSRKKGPLNSAPGYSCPKRTAPTPLSLWPTALRGPRTTASSVSPSHSLRRVLSC